MSPLSPVTPAAPPEPPAADPRPGKKPRGNPTLALAPRCGARTRAGCPCRSPAVHGKLRCRMHGGRSTGPRTPKGLADLRAARTIHGFDGVEARARDRCRITGQRRARVGMAAQRYQAYLPPAFAARLYGYAPELMAPPRPTGGITAAMDRVRRRAVAAGLAPWKQAIAEACAAERAARAAARLAKAHATVGGRRRGGTGVPGAHAPIPGAADSAAAGRPAKPGAPVGARPARGGGVPGPYAPIPGAAEPAAAGSLAKPGAPVGARPARDAGVRGAHAPIPGAAEPEAAARLAKPGAPVGALPPRGAGVPGAHAPIPGAAEPEAAAHLAEPRARVGARYPRGAGVPGAHAPIPGAAGTGFAVGSKRMAGSSRAMTGGGTGGPKPYAPISGPALVPLEPATGLVPVGPLSRGSPAMPPGLPNRAARRRWKRLQRLMRRAAAAGTSA